MDIKDRMNLVENAIVVMKELLVNHDERIEKQQYSFTESRKDFEFKWNALIDAQLQNETEIRELRNGAADFNIGLSELKESTLRLRDASESQLRRIELLEDK